MKTYAFTFFGSVLVVLGMSGAASAATIAQYSFDSLTNDNKTVADISGNGRDVTWNSARTLSSDNAFGQSGDMSAQVKYATGRMININDINFHKGLDGTTDQFTFEGWIKPSSLAGTANLVYMRDSADGQANLRLAMGADGDVNGLVYAQIYTAGGHSVPSKLYSPEPLKVNEWNYVALIVGGGKAHMYVKNSQYTTLTEVATLTLQAPILPSGFSDFAYVADYGEQTNVLFDDIRISDAALDTADLGYRQSFTPEPASLSLLALGGVMLMRRRRKHA